MLIHLDRSCHPKRQGKNARDRILAALEQQPDQSREQLRQSTGLTYQQVRDQTHNLCVAGLIRSGIGSRGERRYTLSQGIQPIQE